MADVVPDLHVLDALGHRESRRPENPPGGGPAAVDHQPGRGIEYPLEADGAADVGGVGLAERLGDVPANANEFVAECLDVRVVLDIGDGHGVLRFPTSPRPEPGGAPSGAASRPGQ